MSPQAFVILLVLVAIAIIDPGLSRFSGEMELRTSSPISALRAPTNEPYRVAAELDRLVITQADQPVAEYVFRDPQILRPYFANVRAPHGLKLTRNHPPVAGVDGTDHDAMHPGMWLGFGELSGHDFWRNQGRIEHVRFITRPVVDDGQLDFATESQLLTAAGKRLGRLTSQIKLATRPAGRLLIWQATFHADDQDITFGDQEEMGFGARIATPLAEKNGGRVINSRGQQSAAGTWGQPAEWCDYSGTQAGQQGGITLMAAATNFRPSWWHNRDYGVFVANPFGRAAMKQGQPSTVTVKRGDTFRIAFAAMLHDQMDYDPAAAYQDFLRLGP